MDSKKTGQVIAGRRVELAMTQKQLAEQLHISDRTVSRWERGVGFPDLSLLEPLADALELSVVELLRGGADCPGGAACPGVRAVGAGDLSYLGTASETFPVAVDHPGNSAADGGHRALASSG